ncbi:MAG: hypothetical protein EP343_19150 [Deltaproteobacteria bacterium]|nr:MAG: hypothetical protein EP343_19150 [Deltaproteobacteria bacterium]
MPLPPSKLTVPRTHRRTLLLLGLLFGLFVFLAGPEGSPSVTQAQDSARAQKAEPSKKKVRGRAKARRRRQRRARRRRRSRRRRRARRRKRRRGRRRRVRRRRRRTKRRRRRRQSRSVERRMLRKIRRVRRWHAQIPSSVVSFYLQRLPSLARDVVVVPHQRRKVSGFRLSYLRRYTVLHRLGFRKGDVITSVNGYKIDTPTRAMMAYVALRNHTTFLIQVRRRGRFHKHLIEIKGK